MGYLFSAIGFGFGGFGPDDQSSPEHPIPDWQSTPASDPLADFGLNTEGVNGPPDLVESRRFRITEGTVTGKNPKINRGNSSW
jgi:hypothetical protein